MEMSRKPLVQRCDSITQMSHTIQLRFFTTSQSCLKLFPEKTVQTFRQQNEEHHDKHALYQN